MDDDSPVTNQVSAKIIQQAVDAQAARASQQQTSGATNTNTVGSSGLSPTVQQVGAVTYYNPNDAMKALHDDAVARGVPNVPAYYLDTKSYITSDDAQKAIDAYYAKIPSTYNVNDTLQKIHDDAVAKGIPGVPDVPKYNSLFTDQNIAQRAITNYSNSIPPTYDVNSAIKSIHDEAVAKGIPGVPDATTTNTVYVDKAVAQAAIDAYSKSIPPTYDVNTAIQEAHDAAVKQGIPNVPATVTDSKVYVDQKEAQAAIDAYTKTIPPTYDVNGAIQQAHDNAVAQGIPNVPSIVTDNKVYIDQKEAQAAIDAYTKTIPPTYNVTDAMKSVHDAAVKEGIPNVPDVPKVTTVYTDSAKAQAAVDAYTKSVPQVYNVTASLQSVHDTAVKQGIPNVPDVPKDSTVYTDSKKAQAVIDAYVKKINANIPSTTAAASTTKSTVAPTTKSTAPTTTQSSAPVADAKQYVDPYKFTTVENITYTTTVPSGASTFDWGGHTYIIPKDASTVSDMDLASWNSNLQSQGKPQLTAQQYDVVSGNYGQRQIQKSAAQNIDPSKTTGYTFYTSLDSDQKEAYMKAKDNNPSLTEYQYRQSISGGVNGAQLLMTVAGIYTDVTYGSFGHSVNTAPIGSGDVKLAQIQQTKVTTNSDGSTGKAVVVDSKGVPVVKVASTAPITQSVNGVKTSATTTTLPVSVQAVNVKNGYTPTGTSIASVSATKVTSTSASHPGQTQVGDGIWKDNTGATVNHTNQTQLKDGTWLDNVIKEGNSSTGVAKQENVKLTTVSATSAQIAAAAKNIDKVYTLNPDGTATIKPGAKPTEADTIALDNAQYKLTSGTPTKPVTVAFGSTSITGSYNPLTGSVTDPAARQKIIDAQIQAAANTKAYTQQVKAAQITGKDGQVIDAVQKVGSGTADNTNIVSPLFTNTTDKNKFLADSKAAYETFVGTGAASLGDLIRSTANSGFASPTLNKLQNAENAIAGDLSKASFLVQSSGDIEASAKARNDTASLQKIAVTGDMTDAQKSQVQTYNAAIEQARADEESHASPTEKAALDAKYSKIDIPKGSVAASASAISLVGVASASPDTKKEEKKKAEDAYVTDQSSDLDKVLSYVIPQGAIKDIDAALGYAGSKLNDADKYVSGVLSLPSYESLKPSLDAAEMYNPLTGGLMLGEMVAGAAYNEFSHTGLGKTVLGTKVAGNTSIGDVVNTVSNVNSGVSKGIENFVKDQYTELKEKPVTFIGENAALALVGGGAGKALGIVGAEAGGIAADVATKLGFELSEGASPIAKIIGKGVDLGFTGAAIVQGAEAAKVGYEKGGIAGGVEAALDFTKNATLSTAGFKAGAGSVSSPFIVNTNTGLKAQAQGKDLFSQVGGAILKEGENAAVGTITGIIKGGEAAYGLAQTGIIDVEAGYNAFEKSGIGKIVSPYINTGMADAIGIGEKAASVVGNAAYQGVKSTIDANVFLANKAIDAGGVAGKFLADNYAKDSPLGELGQGMVNFSKGDRLANALGIVNEGVGIVESGLDKLDKYAAPLTNWLPSSKDISSNFIYQGIKGVTNDVATEVEKDNPEAATAVEVGKSVGGTLENMAGGAYDYGREHPVTTGIELAATYAGGEVLGAGFKGAQILGKGLLVGGGELLGDLGEGALIRSGLAEMIGGESGIGVARTGIGIGKGTFNLAAKAVDPATDVYFQSQLVHGGQEAYGQGKNPTESGQYLGQYIGGTAASLLGFSKGAKNAETFFETGKLADLAGLGIHKSGVPLWVERLEPQLGKEDVVAQTGKIVNGEYKVDTQVEKTVNMFGVNVPIDMSKSTVLDTRETTINGQTVDVPTRRMVNINGADVPVDVRVKEVSNVGSNNNRLVEIVQIPKAERAPMPTVGGVVTSKVQGAVDTIGLAKDIAKKAPEIVKNTSLSDVVSTISGMTTGEKALNVANPTLSYVVGEGAGQHMVSIPFGKEIRLGDDVILSKSTGDRYRLGQSAAPPERFLEGNLVIAHTSEEVPYMRALVEKYGSEADKQIFSSMLESLDKIQDAPNTGKVPNKITVTSSLIPENMHGKNPRKDIVGAIKSVVGGRDENDVAKGTDVQVSGSVSTELQLEDLFGRKTKDLELYVNNLDLSTADDKTQRNPKSKEVAQQIVSYMKSNGYSDGDIRAKGSKIEFSDGKGGWNQSVELFDHNFDKMDKELIDYGYHASKPIMVDGIRVLSTKEQAVRKARAANVFQVARRDTALTGIGPQNEAYLKHAGDFIDLNVQADLESKGKVDVGQNALDYANGLHAKFADNKDREITRMYGEKLKDNPNYNFLIEHQRMPTLDEVKNKDANGQYIANKSILDGVKKSAPSITMPGNIPIRPAITSTGVAIPGREQGDRGLSGIIADVRSSISPEKSKLAIAEETGRGRNAKLTTKKYGDVWKLGDTALFSRDVNGNYELGTGAAPENLISKRVGEKGKSVVLKPGNASQIDAYKATVQKYGRPTQSRMVDSALHIMDVLSAKEEPAPTGEFKLISADVPEEVRPIVENTINNYSKKGFVQVSGSSSTYAQLGDFAGSSPHDIESYTDKPTQLAREIKQDLTKNGYKEGKDFKLMPDQYGKLTKVGFPTDEVGRNGKPLQWKGGIELFKSEKQDYGWGLNEQAPTKMGNTNLMTLTDQAGHKLDASFSLIGSGKSGDVMVGPRGADKVKHLGHFVDIAVKRAATEKLPIEGDIVDLVNNMDKDYMENTTKSQEAYKQTYVDKVRDSPNVKFVREHQRMPTPEEAAHRDAKGQIIADPSIQDGSRTYTPIDVDTTKKADLTGLTRPGRLSLDKDNTKLHIGSKQQEIKTGNIITLIGEHAHKADNHVSLLKPIKDTKNKVSMLIGSTRGQVFEFDPQLGHDDIAVANRRNVLALSGSGDRVTWARGTGGGTKVGGELAPYGDPYSRVIIRDSNNKIISNPFDKKNFNEVKHFNLLAEYKDNNRKGYQIDDSGDPTFNKNPGKAILGSFVSVADASEPNSPTSVSSIFTRNNPNTNPNPMSWLGRTAQRGLTGVADLSEKASLIDRLSTNLDKSDIIVKVDKGKKTNVVKPESSVWIGGEKKSLVLGDVIPGTEKLVRVNNKPAYWTTERRATIGGESTTVESRSQVIGSYKTDIIHVKGAERPTSAGKTAYSLLTGITGGLAAAVGDVDKPGTHYMGGEVLLGKNYRTTEVSDNWMAKALKEYNDNGKLSRETAKEFEDASVAQAKKYNEPVLGLTPKIAEGWLQPENEMFLYMPDGTKTQANKVTGIKNAGRTIGNVKIKEVTLGGKDEKTLPTSRVGKVVNKLVSKYSPVSWENRKENIKWNLSVSKDEFGKYNKSLQDYTERTVTLPRIRQEILKTESIQKGAPDYMKHGPEHMTNTTKGITEQVAELKKKESTFTLNKDVSDDEYAKLLGQYHDLAKAGEKEMPGIDHAKSIARTIKKGDTGDVRIDKLSQKTRNQLARDIAYHDIQQPFSSGDLPAAIKTTFKYRTSDAAKMLSNSDRGDLPRFGITVDPYKKFEVGLWRKMGRDIAGTPDRVTGLVSPVTEGAAKGVSAMMTDTTATLGGGKNIMGGDVKDTKIPITTQQKQDKISKTTVNADATLVSESTTPTTTQKEIIKAETKAPKTQSKSPKASTNGDMVTNTGTSFDRLVSESESSVGAKHNKQSMITEMADRKTLPTNRKEVRAPSEANATDALYNELTGEKKKLPIDNKELPTSKSGKDIVETEKGKNVITSENKMYELSNETKDYANYLIAKNNYAGKTAKAYDKGGYKQKLPIGQTYKASAYNPEYDKPSYENALYEKPYGDKPYEKTPYEKSYEKTPYEKSYEKTPYEKTPYEKTYGEKPYEKTYSKPYGKSYEAPYAKSYGKSYEAPYQNAGKYGFGQYQSNYPRGYEDAPKVTKYDITSKPPQEERKKEKLRKNEELHRPPHKDLTADADKLVVRTKVQTFKEAMSGKSITTPTLDTSDDSLTGESRAPPTTKSKIPTGSNVGTFRDMVNGNMKSGLPKQPARTTPKQPPKQVTNQISKTDMNKLSTGVQNKIKAIQKEHKTQGIPKIGTNEKPVKVTESNMALGRFMGFTAASKQKDQTKTKSKKDGKNGGMLNGLL